MKRKSHKPPLHPLLPAVVLAMGLLGFQLAPAATGNAGEQHILSYSQEGIRRVYQRGMEAFKKGDHQVALYWFDVFLDAFPDSNLADNALYWKGEVHYTMKDYAEAAAAFGQVLARFPQGNKAPAAMLKLSLSYNEMGDRNEAMKYLKRVVSTYPGTEAARQAEIQIKDMQSGK